MGNKVTCCRIVIYCGCPAKRKKSKEKEHKEAIAAREAHEIFVCAEKTEQSEDIHKAVFDKTRLAKCLLQYDTSDYDEYLPVLRKAQPSVSEMDLKDDGQPPFSERVDKPLVSEHFAFSLNICDL